MMFEKDNLGLRLGFNFPTTAGNNRSSNTSSLHSNLMPVFTSSSSSSSPFNLLHKTPNCTDSFPSSSDRRNGDAFGAETRSFLKGIDVNRTPVTVGEAEEEAGVSSPNSTLSSVSGKRSERDLAVDDHDGGGGERSPSRGNNSDEEDGDNCRKKLRLSKDQSAVLEESFKEHSTLNPKQKLALAKRLGLRPRQVEVWFQNRRARTKLKQTEVDCELMKRWCENLTEENRRLQKELQELRALKLSPQFYMQMAPPTTLTMCLSCDRAAAPPPSSTTAATPEKPADHRHDRFHLLGVNQDQDQNHCQKLSLNPWATRVA